jgi:hypothetical protein
MHLHSRAQHQPPLMMKKMQHLLPRPLASVPQKSLELARQ